MLPERGSRQVADDGARIDHVRARNGRAVARRLHDQAHGKERTCSHAVLEARRHEKRDGEQDAEHLVGHRAGRVPDPHGQGTPPRAHDGLGEQREPIRRNLARGHRHHRIPHGAAVSWRPRPRRRRAPRPEATLRGCPSTRSPNCAEAAKPDLSRQKRDDHEVVAREQLRATAQHELEPQAEADAAHHALRCERHGRIAEEHREVRGAERDERAGEHRRDEAPARIHARLAYAERLGLRQRPRPARAHRASKPRNRLASPSSKPAFPSSCPNRREKPAPPLVRAAAPRPPRAFRRRGRKPLRATPGSVSSSQISPVSPSAGRGRCARGSERHREPSKPPARPPPSTARGDCVYCDPFPRPNADSLPRTRKAPLWRPRPRPIRFACCRRWKRRCAPPSCARSRRSWSAPCWPTACARPIGGLRRRILAGERPCADASEAARAAVEGAVARALAYLRPSLRRVVNATGVVVHTNLGRSPLPEEAVRAVADVARGYSTLEYDVGSMARGSRHDHVERLVCALTGARRHRREQQRGRGHDGALRVRSRPRGRRVARRARGDRRVVSHPRHHGAFRRAHARGGHDEQDPSRRLRARARAPARRCS